MKVKYSFYQAVDFTRDFHESVVGNEGALCFETESF